MRRHFIPLKRLSSYCCARSGAEIPTTASKSRQATTVEKMRFRRIKVRLLKKCRANPTGAEAGGEADSLSVQGGTESLHVAADTTSRAKISARGLQRIYPQGASNELEIRGSFA